MKTNVFPLHPWNLLHYAGKKGSIDELSDELLDAKLQFLQFKFMLVNQSLQSSILQEKRPSEYVSLIQ